MTSEGGCAPLPTVVARLRRAPSCLPQRRVARAEPALEADRILGRALMTQRNEINILRRRIDASVLRVKALGGGWSVAELPAP